ncbi:phage holin family protein [Lutispora saccharofermentans]|uniref:Phage holin family protein n=1 Tax=Lutispora saccharofermentans TaxID=3024236 RepID=A0ABT1NCR5_9FIRM|nr:phage holin family protein [Lutispora saccharofermentans]MCQ1528834.1 phage holin family protein [Lutispora saccharofermentans]
MKNSNGLLQAICTFIGAFIGRYIGGFDGIIYTLLVFIVVDYITGVLVAIIQQKLSSEIGYKGISKKVLIFMLIGIGHAIDSYVTGQQGAIRTAIAFFYLANEGISIIENYTKIGLPIPQKLKSILKELHDDANIK